MKSNKSIVVKNTSGEDIAYIDRLYRDKIWNAYTLHHVTLICSKLMKRDKHAISTHIAHYLCEKENISELIFTIYVLWYFNRKEDYVKHPNIVAFLIIILKSIRKKPLLNRIQNQFVLHLLNSVEIDPCLNSQKIVGFETAKKLFKGFEYLEIPEIVCFLKSTMIKMDAKTFELLQQQYGKDPIVKEIMQKRNQNIEDNEFFKYLYIPLIPPVDAPFMNYELLSFEYEEENIKTNNIEDIKLEVHKIPIIAISRQPYTIPLSSETFEGLFKKSAKFPLPPTETTSMINDMKFNIDCCNYFLENTSSMVEIFEFNPGFVMDAIMLLKPLGHSGWINDILHRFPLTLSLVQFISKLYNEEDILTEVSIKSSLNRILEYFTNRQYSYVDVVIFNSFIKLLQSILVNNKHYIEEISSIIKQLCLEQIELPDAVILYSSLTQIF